MDVIREYKIVPKLRFEEFKNSWVEKMLGDIGETFNGLTGKTKEDFGKGKPFIQYMQIFNSAKINTTKFGYVDVKEGEKQKTVQYGDIFFTTSSETPMEIGYASVLTEEIQELYLNSFCFGYRPSSLNELYPNFASYLFRCESLRKQIVRLAQGSTRYNMSKVQLMKELIKLPSLDEQQKIASFLSVVDEKLQQLTKKKELLEEYKKGVMQKIFLQELRFKDNNGNNYPDWKEKKLNEVFYSKRGSGLSGKNIVIDGKNKCILYGALYTNYGEVIDEVIESTNEDGSVKSQIGDILVPASTTTTGIDLANFTALNQEGVLLGGDISILRFSKKGHNIFWAYYLTHYKKYEVASYAQGSTIVHIYFSHFGKTQIEEPSIQEQQKIANFLSSLDIKIDLVSTQIENTKAFKKGLLQQMFV